MKFTKMNGLGNDYIYVDLLEEKVDYPENLSIKLCDRNRAIGGDGLVLIDRIPCSLEFSMRIFNADGSEANMCGNAIRCVARYVYDKGYTRSSIINIRTKTGVKTAYLTIKKGVVTNVKVDMGIPRFLLDTRFKLLNIDANNIAVYPISVGNNHVVYITNESLDYAFDFAVKIATEFNNDVNVEVVRVIDKNNIEMRVLERGSGETLACGTGATASAFATMALGLTNDTVNVILKGGVLTIEKSNTTYYMSGIAEYNFKGETYDG